MSDWPGWKAGPAGAGRVPFPQAVVVEVKALACELPSEEELPFSRFSCDDIAREAVRRGIVASISGRTVWRWLDADAIRPWLYRSWIFPRDKRFAEKAGRVLDLYRVFPMSMRNRGRPGEVTKDQRVVSAPLL